MLPFQVSDFSVGNWGDKRFSSCALTALCCASAANTIVVSTPDSLDLLSTLSDPYNNIRYYSRCFHARAIQYTSRHRSPSVAILITMAIGKRLTASYTGPFDPTHRFETSWILPPAVLFGIRALLSLYAFVTLFTIFGWNGTHGRSGDSERSFSYFTHLTYWGLAFYNAFSAAHTGSYWLTGTPFLARWPKWLQVAHGMFYSTIVVYPWIVTGKSQASARDVYGLEGQLICIMCCTSKFPALVLSILFYAYVAHQD